VISLPGNWRRSAGRESVDSALRAGTE
jgi:hypothetical protein